MAFWRQPWLWVSKDDLRIEWQQLADEGRDRLALRGEYEALAEADLDGDPTLQAAAQGFLDAAGRLPFLSDYPYTEPNELDGIRAARPPAVALPDPLPDDDTVAKRLHGAWLGRIAGCMLGKPVEGWTRARLAGFLAATDNLPLHRYLRQDVPAEVRAEYLAGARLEAFADRLPHAIEDDDTNYTALNLLLLQAHGPQIAPGDFAAGWMRHLPILHTCTAERAAYRNFCLGVAPPAAARRRNPYREWIGAQIRADACGYVAAGVPEAAAALAWRDACISHTRNGIYGEMWAAAMIAAALRCADPATIIRAGLAQIPAHCRLAEDVGEVLDWHARGLPWADAIAEIHDQWDEGFAHHWCHTNSNAMIVAAALLYGEGDVSRGLGLAVQPGFDTDCNGATVGSVLGMMHGADAIPAAWTAPLRNTLATGIAGYHQVAIDDLAAQTHALWRDWRAEH